LSRNIHLVLAQIASRQDLSKLRLTLACWDYDRTRPLMDGVVKPEGIDLNYIPMWVEETFYRMLNNKEFDASEMSLSAYTSLVSRGVDTFTAIPVFPSRTFRHRSIYVSKKSGIREPKELAGKKVGVQRYRQTAGVWIRGILEEYYNLPVESVTYIAGGLELPERESRFWGLSDRGEKIFNPNIKLVDIGNAGNLSAMLERGEIDALYSARMPSSFVKGEGVERLFPNYEEEEKQYFRKSGIFPIMHTIVIRRDVYQSNRWVALSLLKAFQRSKEVAYRENYQTGALRYMLPWMNREIEEATALMGEDYWPYGFEENKKLLKTFLDYSYSQGLLERKVEPKELFAEETLEPFKKDAHSPM